MYEFQKVICVCECFIYTKGVHLSLLLMRDCLPKKLKYHSSNDQDRRSVEMTSRIIEKKSEMYDVAR